MLAIEIPQYTYSTGAVARHTAYALDMHYGSELFNKRKFGPAIALVGAVGSISAGAAMGGFLGGMMIAGGIASGLGAITGNKTLSTLGMGLGLVGGIGGAFTNATTGEFMNPFAEGAKFSDTALGSGFSKIKSFFSDVSTTPDLTSQMATTGNEITQGVSGETIAKNAGNTAESMSNTLVRDVNNNVTSGGSLGQSIKDTVSGSGGGLLSSLGSSKDLLGIASGLADGYNQQQQLDQQQPLFDARTNQINADTALQQQRYNNMQNQNVGLLQANSNANIFKPQTNNTAGKYAVVINGEVKYLSQQEYDAMKQAQTTPNLPQG